MTSPAFTLNDLIQAGVHFGHRPGKWNPKMDQFIFCKRNNIHIINLEKTGPLLERALEALKNTASSGGHILFIGTKKQAASATADAALRSQQYFVNHRWLGGTLTNWKTISNSIHSLKKLDELLTQDSLKITKKELLQLVRKRSKLNIIFGGIKDMPGLPDVLFIIDAQREQTAIQEANKMGITVIAVADSNANTNGIDYLIPGNDDAIRTIRFYYNVAVQSILDGLTSRKEHQVEPERARTDGETTTS